MFQKHRFEMNTFRVIEKIKDLVFLSQTMYTINFLCLYFLCSM